MDADFGDKKYAAPELFAHMFTPKADVFSLGITIAEVYSHAIAQSTFFFFQISVPSSSPLSEDEWESIRKIGTLPDREYTIVRIPCEMKTKNELFQR